MEPECFAQVDHVVAVAADDDETNDTDRPSWFWTLRERPTSSSSLRWSMVLVPRFVTCQQFLLAAGWMLVLVLLMMAIIGKALWTRGRNCTTIKMINLCCWREVSFTNWNVANVSGNVRIISGVSIILYYLLHLKHYNNTRISFTVTKNKNNFLRYY